VYKEWMHAEWTMMSRLWDEGAPVPFPVARTGDGMLMEYIGDREMAAPRLAQAGSAKHQLPPLFAQFRDGLLSFCRAGVVHGDLSPYNLLVWQEALWFIDLPQAVPYLANPNATDFLYRDVCNVCGWFARRGLDVDRELLFAEAMSELFEFKTKDLFVAQD
ncbi:MAG: RIO1 family regulatory kinase/ATPase, partial [Actinomycetota bacterium]